MWTVCLPGLGQWNDVDLQAAPHSGSVPSSQRLVSQRAGKSKWKTATEAEMRQISKTDPESFSYLIDAEGQFGSCSLTYVDGAAFGGVTLHDGEYLQVTWSWRQVEVGQPGLFKVMEVSFSESVPRVEG